MVWLKFLICVVIILLAGTRLARYGDVIAEKTRLGGMWVGLLFLAVITSMPELVTGVSSTTLVGLPDLGLGTLLGSCLFNLTIIAVLDVLYRPAPLLSKASSWHMISAGLGMLLTIVAAGGILAGESLSGVALGWVGIPSVIILIFYLIGVRGLFHFERKCQLLPVEAVIEQYEENSVRTVWFKFALAAAAVVGAGIWLSFVGDEIARTTGWGPSFIGSLFLAISTSMPELVVTIVAVRLGAIDMAVADILGANILDVAYIFAVDLFYVEGVITSLVSEAHLITAAGIIMMSAVVILGILFQQKRKPPYIISWYGLVLIGLYILSAYALFTLGMGL